MSDISRVSGDVFSGIAGNERLISFFRERIANGDLAHAYTLEGPDGSGKTMLAYAVAAAAAGPEFARKVQNGDSADVKLIVPENGRKSVSVDDIRAVKADAALTPNELDCRFYIFDEAQDMSPMAQNTLLKILEEPSEGVYFFLLCTSAAGLLPTVRSRAPVMRMEILGDGEIRGYLLKNFRKAGKLSPEEIDLAVRMSHGTIGGAAASLTSKALAGESGTVKLICEIIDILRRLGEKEPSEIPAAKRDLYSLTQKLPGDRLALSDLFEKTGIAVRDLLAARFASDSEAQPPEMLFYPSYQAALDALGGLSAQTLARAIDILENAIYSLSLNVNVYSTQIAALTALARA